VNSFKKDVHELIDLILNANGSGREAFFAIPRRPDIPLQGRSF
tara:strand:- start:521 stop:649 length:129 start_codon:yes stop_codon:yes gene_type:complete